MKVVELSDDPRSLSPLAVLPSVNYQIINADYLLLRDTSQDVMDNSSLRSQRQPFILTGLNGQPAINVSYGPMSLEQSIPLHMIHTGPRIRPFILARQVRSSTPALYVLFYATGLTLEVAESKIRRGPQHGDLGRQIYGTSMKRIGTVNLLRSPPGNPTFMRLRLGGAVIIQTSSKPLKTTDTATFYVFLTMFFVVLFQDTELLNTAVLTGKRVSVPVKVLGVEADGSITDITNSSHCRSSDQDVLKVSERCDSVYVNGKETCGRVRMMVNFTYSYLSTQLEVSVWMPRLPLHMEISDPELSQIKAWRVPVTGNKRVSWDTEEEDERKGRGCMLQYQHSLIRVLTVFTAESPDPSSPSPAYFLGSDWQVDVTRLVRYFLRVGDTSIARLQAGSVLTGKAVGVTTVQVMSPLSNSVLAERMIRVLDDKVSITELGVHSRAIVAKTTTQEIIHYPKQEAVVGCWLKFSDGSQTPLDLYDPSGYSLTISSLDPRVASVRKIPGSIFVVVAESEGQGLLLRAELAICEACQKSKRKSKLAVGGGMVKVKFPPDEQLAGTGRKESDRANDGEDGDKLILTSPLNTLQHTVIQESTTNAIKAATKSNFQEAIGDGLSTIKSINTMDKTLITKPVADRALVTVGPRSPIKNGYGNLLENANFPFPPEEPKREPPLVESDLIQMFSVFTDIEVCIYALVGLSCLAVIAILLHCATNSGQSEHKHHWVRLGTAAEQNRAVPIATTSKQEITNTLPPRRDPMAPLPPMAVRSATLLARPVRSEPLHSPTNKRNRVQFTTFATLDIKHLAALKNGQNFSWASQPVGGSQAASIGQGGLNGKAERVNHVHFCSPVEVFGQTPESKDSQGFLPEGPWPVATPVSKV
uniref:Si:dkey-1d7.3 n=1 Tax=Sinocyclocheilus anshuiensis TaxID=1608454 RepID=A0A671S082_9TELE